MGPGLHMVGCLTSLNGIGKRVMWRTFLLHCVFMNGKTQLPFLSLGAGYCSVG